MTLKFFTMHSSIGPTTPTVYYITRSTYVYIFTYRLALVFDFMLIVIPVELAVTLLNNHLIYTTLVTIGASIVIIIWSLLRRKNNIFDLNVFLGIDRHSQDNNNIHCSYGRAYINLFTVFAILAVDFSQLFPLSSRKSSAYGTRLMDTGVGFYISINASISSEARGTKIKG